MKKTLIATAIAGAMSFSVAAQAAPTVYGNIQVVVDVENDNTAADNGSTIGIKGEEALNNGLTGIYKIEMDVNAAGTKGDNSPFTGDQAYLGVKGNFGTVRVGSMDTVADDLIGDAIFGEEYVGGEFSAFIDGANREIQQVQYSGEFGAVEARASVNLNGKNVDSDLDNAVQVGVKVAVAEGVSVAAAFDTYQSAAGVAATLDMGALSAGASFETQDDVDAIVSASGAFNYGMGSVYAIASMFDTGDIDGNRVTAGANYSLADSMYVYAEVVSGDNDDLSDAKSTALGAVLVF
ncbi:porin [Oceanospirillum sp.]|uniref:porin n=1 Tax=Oceanospirillum sp. TaxID=2021254 RepID=UPI003A945162